MKVKSVLRAAHLGPLEMGGFVAAPSQFMFMDPASQHVHESQRVCDRQVIQIQIHRTAQIC